MATQTEDYKRRREEARQEEREIEAIFVRIDRRLERIHELSRKSRESLEALVGPLPKS